ncbi:MAG TPA: baseplate J/gp47 family protein, partial [Kofleriaceae bacterium]|nr:baseplate J/gp47 family protein [Kofleriaceae bacterium]
MNLSDLTTPLTEDQAKQAIYDALATLGLSTTSWKPGAWVRTIIAVFAKAYSSLTSLTALIASGGFLFLAKGDWLTLVAQYVYGVTRDPGSFASGNIQFDNSGGGIYSGVAGDLIVANTSTGKAYRNTAPYTIGALATGVLIPFQAVELGSASTSTPATITTLGTPLPGVTVTNPGALVGLDAETDDALVLRCSEKTGALSPNGPRDAYAYLARSATLNGVSVGVTRVKTIPDGIGGVDVYVADKTGTLTGTVGDLTTALGVVDEAIQTQCAPLGITARVHAATPHAIAVTYELWIRRTSLADADVKSAVATQITNFLATIPIGGFDLTGAGGAGKVYLGGLK